MEESDPGYPFCISLVINEGLFLRAVDDLILLACPVLGKLRPVRQGL